MEPNNTLEVFEGIQDRKGMTQYFDGVMDSTYSSIRDNLEQEFGENLVKTYSLELHNPEMVQKKLDAFLLFLKEDGFSVKQIGEDRLFSVYKPDFLIFIDGYNPRFLLAHSPSKATVCTEFIDAFIKRYPTLDRTWYNTSIMEKLSYYGDFESWKTVYSSKKVFSETELKLLPSLDWEELHFSIKSRNPRKKLEEIREKKIFENTLPITGIRIKRETMENNFAREDIGYSGKFTARGNNFTDHLEVVTEFTRTYSNVVETIEQNYALEFHTDIGFKGEPITIEFPPIKQEHFQIIIKNWFSGNYPFLLWGLIEFKLTDYAIVQAIDLHIGHQLAFEVGPDFMRIYLQNGVCGNTVTRLLTNMEQYFSSSVKIYNAELNQLFSPT